MTILEAVRRAFNGAGLSLLPVCEDGSKAPDVSRWRAFTETRPTVQTMRAWNFATRAGFGMVAGVASQHREAWDFDDEAVFRAYVDAAHACGLGDVVARIRAGYEDQTPGGGRRWIVTYPATIAWKDCTLARRPGRAGEPKVKVTIELPTFAILAPSNGATHPSGRPYVHVSGGFDTIAAYTADERDDLIALARTFDALPRTVRGEPATPAGAATGTRPGDDFNRRQSWATLLGADGWTVKYIRDGEVFWYRPGKTAGSHSATTNYHGSDLLYVFSSSTPFDTDVSYSKFGAYTVLHHGGDYRQAALALSKLGYGNHPDATAATAAPIPSPDPCTLGDVNTVFTRWLGEEYDLAALHAVLAVAAAEQLEGDPAWLLVVSGSGNAKTETVQSLRGAGAYITSTISSEGALLSGSAKRERTRDATGGLLRRIGDHGLLVIKDVTSILAMGRDCRASLLAALREIHDGRWERNVGTDGGRSLTWSGRVVIVGAVTTAWDRRMTSIASMGDRFVIVRMDSTTGRMPAGRRACRNTGDEVPHAC